MKYAPIKIIILFFMIATIFMSCKNNIHNYQTEIYQPKYISYNSGEERGYRVSFQTSNEIEVPVAVIINKIKMPIRQDSKNGRNYNVNVIATSRLLQDYHAENSDKENGIVFQSKNSGEFFRPIQFNQQ